ncbi:hypothetical protein GQ53DRAFT_351190 [Thozetella sp. PMI_491]|nr:hypothetical protein GQ53DRAFT_351190 [Thozetella sp. PMI_491]
MSRTGSKLNQPRWKERVATTAQGYPAGAKGCGEKFSTKESAPISSSPRLGGNVIHYRGLLAAPPGSLEYSGTEVRPTRSHGSTILCQFKGGRRRSRRVSALHLWSTSTQPPISSVRPGGAAQQTRRRRSSNAACGCILILALRCPGAGLGP